MSDSTCRLWHWATSSGPRSPAASTAKAAPSTSRTPAATGIDPETVPGQVEEGRGRDDLDRHPVVAAQQHDGPFRHEGRPGNGVGDDSRRRARWRPPRAPRRWRRTPRRRSRHSRRAGRRTRDHRRPPRRRPRPPDGAPCGRNSAPRPRARGRWRRVRAPARPGPARPPPPWDGPQSPRSDGPTPSINRGRVRWSGRVIPAPCSAGGRWPRR